MPKKLVGGLSLVEGTVVHDIAVFWDFQNIGVKQDSSFAKDVLEFLKSRGRVVAAYAYADWIHASEETANVLFRNRFELIHVPSPSKNSADVLMTAHAMAHLTSAPTITEYALISKDYDFRPLVANLQRMGKKVLLICRPIEVNPELIEMVDEYVDIQSLRAYVDERVSEQERQTTEEAPADKATERRSAFAQLQEVVRAITARENIPGIGYTKIVMTSLNPGFDEDKLGFAKWGDFVTAAADAGFVVLEGQGASTILKVPIKLSRSTKDSLDSLQKGFDFLVSTVRKMEEEKKSTELVRLALLMHSTDPSFSHANLGFRKFYDLVKAAEQRGLVRIELVLGNQPLVHSMD